MDPLVSIIIPAYNAERTLDATLQSVRAQSYRNLEIFVIDDGSQDRTVAIAERHAREDERVTVLKKQNGGVAEARNYPLARLKGEFVAPVDADDLWAPDKIRRQVDVMLAAGETCSLVYSWFAIIDDRDRILVLKENPMPSGDALREMCVRNLIGNGSGALMRTGILREIGGFDTALRKMGAQGSEDWKLYMQFAERGTFKIVEDYLVGYRESPGNMSRNLMIQLKSHDIVAEEFSRRHPDMTPWLKKGRIILLRFMMARCMRDRNFKMVLRLFAISLSQNVLETASSIAYLLGRALKQDRHRGSRQNDPAIGMDYFAFASQPRKNPAGGT